jgi:hypothetical protein
MTPKTETPAAPVFNLDGSPAPADLIKAYKPIVRLAKCDSLAHAERLSEASGFHWFKPDSMRYFKCRLGAEFYANNGLIFISSEKPNWAGATRLYTVRVVAEGGQIETFGPFHYYSKLGAKRVARLLVKQLCKGLVIADTEGNRFSL